MNGQVNLSAVLYKANDLRLEPRPIPTPADNEVLIRVSCVGICGSDVHYLTRGRNGVFIVENPLVLGHEAAGTVLGCGKDVKHLVPGDRVAIEPAVPCRFCQYCKLGKYNLCKGMVGNGTPGKDGSLCRFQTHVADFCYKLPDHVSLEEGALLEPLSVAVHACTRANITLGSTVLICGAGPIGLFNLLVAKSMGASKIIMTDLVESRLTLAKSLGAHFVLQLNPQDDTSSVIDKIKNALDGESPEIAIECTGVESSIKLAILATRSGGVVMTVGLGSPIVNVPIVDAAVREVDIRGVRRYLNSYPKALALVASGQIDSKKLITHHYKLENALDAFETAKSGAGGAIKIMIHCE